MFAMKAFALVLVLLSATLTGCFATVQSPVPGYLFTSTESAITATGAERGSKRGRASSASVFGLFAFGESSIEAAANRGGIKKISHVDAEAYSILGIYSSYTVVVYGE
jgi:hypothetical protein